MDVTDAGRETADPTAPDAPRWARVGYRCYPIGRHIGAQRRSDIDEHYELLMHLFSLDAMVIGLVGWQAYAFQRRLRLSLERQLQSDGLILASMVPANG